MSLHRRYCLEKLFRDSDGLERALQILSTLEASQRNVHVPEMSICPSSAQRQGVYQPACEVSHPLMTENRFGLESAEWDVIIEALSRSLDVSVRRKDVKHCTELLKFAGLVGLSEETLDSDHSQKGAGLLASAIRGRCTELVDLFLQSGWRAIHVPGNQSNLLEIAFQNGDIQTAQLLIHSGLKASPATGSGQRMLAFSIRKGWVDAVKVLLTAGCDINTPSREYLANNQLSEGTAIVLAIKTRHPEILVELALHGAKLDVRVSGALHSVLDWAATTGRSDILGLILSRTEMQVCKERFRELRQSAFQHAVRTGRVHAVETLLHVGADIEHDYYYGHFARRTPLIVAIRSRQQMTVEILLNKGATPDGCSRNRGIPMMSAIRLLRSSRHWKVGANIMKLLIDAGANVNTNQARLLERARRHPAALRSLLAAGINVKAIHRKLLAKMIMEGPLDALKIVLEAGAEVDGVSWTIVEQLHRACARDLIRWPHETYELRVAALLKDYGLDVFEAWQGRVVQYSI